MNVEIGAEAPLFPEKEYISGIFVVVRMREGAGVGERGAKSDDGEKTCSSINNSITLWLDYSCLVLYSFNTLWIHYLCWPMPKLTTGL
jgi:hypothetical protein